MSPQYADALAWTANGFLALLLGAVVGFLYSGAHGASWGIIVGFGVASVFAAVSAAAAKKNPIPL